MKLLVIKSLSSGEILATFSPSMSDDILYRMTKYIAQYGILNKYKTGSLVLQISFSSLHTLTSFWTKYLDGTLNYELLDILTTDDIRQQHDLSTLNIKMSFTMTDDEPPYLLSDQGEDYVQLDLHNNITIT